MYYELILKKRDDAVCLKKNITEQKKELNYSNLCRHIYKGLDVSLKIEKKGTKPNL